MYKLTFFIIVLAMFTSCAKKSSSTEDFSSGTTDDASKVESGDPTTYDPNRGIGKFTKVELGATLDKTLAADGEKIESVKCSSCHKLTDEKLVGPGWKGVTTRRKPEWIMNFITNPDPMIDKDPKVQAMLELCLVRMPNQALTDDDARKLLEFMRKNDGVN